MVVAQTISQETQPALPRPEANTSEIEGHCVAPQFVPQVWPHVSHFVRDAMAIGLTEFSEVEKQVFAGTMLLWIVWNGEMIIAAIVTQITEHSIGRIGTIVACGGHGLESFAHLRATLENYFKSNGCSILRIFGRPGWSRFLKDYRTQALVLEKEL